jgi:hypothetical protein
LRQALAKGDHAKQLRSQSANGIVSGGHPGFPIRRSWRPETRKNEVNFNNNYEIYSILIAILH